jgi:hypothetical protein
MLCFFRSLIDFDWIEGNLISGRVGSGRVRIESDQFDFLKKSDSDPDRSDGFVRSGRVLPPLQGSLRFLKLKPCFEIVGQAWRYQF